MANPPATPAPKAIQIPEVVILDTTSQSVSVDSDTVTAIFNQGTVDQFTVNNFTSYVIERDFFVPVDAFMLTIEDDRADELRKDIIVGAPITISINEHAQLVGFVEKVDYSYSRSGSVLTLHGRDALGLMADSITPPNNNFNSKSTIKQILIALFQDFNITVGTYSINDAADLSVATAGLVGTANRGKTPNAIAKGWLRSINRQIKPRKEEGYLQYAMRLCKEVGLNIKLLPGTSKIFVNTPIYDRESQPLYQLTNIFADSSGTGGSTGTSKNNNVITGAINLDWQKQPSIIVSEMSGSQQPTFKRDTLKIVQVNEITAYAANGFPYPAITKTVNLLAKTYGYYRVPTNDALVAALPDLVTDQPNVVGTTARTAFLFDEHATKLDELQFFTLKKMAEKQNEFLKLEYVVKDHTFNGFIWNTNLMCKVHDDRLEVYATYWIQKTVFKKSRHEGTTTEISLRLPYVWEFYATDDAKT